MTVSEKNQGKPTTKYKCLVCTLLGCLLAIVQAPAQSPEFMSLEQARPVLAGAGNSLPSELKLLGQIDAGAWFKWAESRDREIRGRLIQGDEDTLTNLLRLGVTYTKEYRITTEYMAEYGESPLVNSFAEQRADDLIRALASPGAKPAFQEMRSFLEQKSFSFKTPETRSKIKNYLLANLARMRQDYLRLTEKMQADRSEAFQDRGISTDTDLWPDFLIEQHLRHMLQKGLLKPGSVHRVALVGPGLDFVNKRASVGYDFYPPQTVQPFAVIDSLGRLGLADTAAVQVDTFDISPRVNIHIERARKKAAGGQSYTVQLLWTTSGLNDATAAEFTAFSQILGVKIGKPVAPVAVPSGASGVNIRAVRVRPEIVTRITPVDMNVVLQHLQPNPQFDLIIGTNIFTYYGGLEQSLTCANLATMLKSGGFLLSNDALAGAASSHLQDDLRTTLAPLVGSSSPETMFTYRRE